MLFVALAVTLAGQTMAADPITGGAGWASAGLFGLVLSWLLMIHLPAKDKQISGLVEAKDKQITATIDAFDARSKEERIAYREALDKVVEHCDRNSERDRQTSERVVQTLLTALETAKAIAIAQQSTVRGGHA